MDLVTAQPSRATVEELSALATAHILRAIVKTRAQLGAGFALIFSVVVITAPDSLRLMAIVGALTVGALVIASGMTASAGEDLDASRRRFGRTLVLAGVMQSIVALALGGVAGPVLPPMAVLALVAAALGPGRTGFVVVVGIQIPAVLAMGWLQWSGAIPELVPIAWRGEWAAPGVGGVGPWVAALFACFALFAAFTLGRTVRDVVFALVGEAVVERDRQLALHADTAATVSQLAAEIGHELKNPLASIKGLSALVRKDLDGTAAERMDVLRREVDRMQSVLEEFLTYSRPVVPLDPDDVDLVALASDVATLHDGLASQRGVTITRPTGAPAHARCDPRKVRQVLINLVQNALEASPRGASVRMQVERLPGARAFALRVIDAGPGLDPAITGKLFEVGATTKKEGSGLGLVVARGLARQHGGELTLASAEPRGCVATLTLPIDGAATAEPT